MNVLEYCPLQEADLWWINTPERFYHQFAKGDNFCSQEVASLVLKPIKMWASLYANNLLVDGTKSFLYKGPAKSFVTGFGLLQCYVLSNIFLVQTFKVFPLY